MVSQLVNIWFLEARISKFFGDQRQGWWRQGWSEKNEISI